jgi:mono/diheme cytochrome c family protein
MKGIKLKLTVAACLGLAIALSARSSFSQADDKTASADVFKDNCSSCHGDDGAGSALGKRLKSPDLRTKEIHDKAASELVKTITDGKDKMPPFGGQLTPDQINALVEYVRSLHTPADTPK